MFSIVLVSYNSGHILANAIRSIPAGNQVIVADNASSDDSISVARGLGAEVVELERNFGFGTACNRGAAIAVHEKLLFLNPDAVLEPDALGHLAVAFDTYPNSVAFNPKILYANGRQYFRWRNALLPRPYLFKPTKMPASDHPIMVASGAAMLVRKSEFDRLGGFDENIFLYYEDDDLSARILKSNRTMHYVHNAVVQHQPWASSAPEPGLSSFREYHAMKSRLYARRKHGRPLMRRWRLVDQAIRWAVATVLGHERKAERAKAMVRALREG